MDVGRRRLGRECGNERQRPKYLYVTFGLRPHQYLHTYVNGHIYINDNDHNPRPRYYPRVNVNVHVHIYDQIHFHVCVYVNVVNLFRIRFYSTAERKSYKAKTH